MATSKETMQGMTVAELIEQLQDLPQDKVVAFGYDYGDHWHTEVVKDIMNVDILEVEYSDYHRMFKVCDSNGDEEDENALHEVEMGDQSIVILR